MFLFTSYELYFNFLSHLEAFFTRIEVHFLCIYINFLFRKERYRQKIILIQFSFHFC